VKSVYKPGSVIDGHSSTRIVTKSLEHSTRYLMRAASMVAYLSLLQVGFTLPRLLPSARCALTAPSHLFPRMG